MTVNCLITGVGGQGTVLMARIIGSAAINRGFSVLGAETIGMAQRGGSVVSHIRLGDGVYSPLIPPGRADVIIAFEPAEAVRVLPFLSPTGKLLALDRGVAPVTSSLGADGAKAGYDPALMTAYLRRCLGERAAIISGENLLRRIGSAKVINVALLGAALARGMLPFTAEHIAAVIRERIPAKFTGMNLAALEAGRSV
ncbi:MAG: indolepyruvate oxidoreductase subunit beta [Treponema sp.]|jgi:indolepyruvate ferredoxin oxidoreductase beta subunit|nr:indolepyruvate oxidoreductase subunit beta [Treponema sp.]